MMKDGYEGMDEKVKEKAMAHVDALKSVLEPTGVSIEEFIEKCGDGDMEPDESDEGSMDNEEGDGEKPKVALIIARMKRKRGM